MEASDNLVFGTDGSGGEHGSDPRVRRCGGAVVAMDKITLQPVGFISFQLPGPIQSVPRAEATAMQILLERTTGSVIAYSDAKCVVDGFTKQRKSNQDVWWKIRRARAERGIRVVHVKSHRPDLIGTPSMTVEAFAVNHHADFFADEAAAAAQLPQQVVNSVAAVDKVAWQIQKRLLAIARHTRRDDEEQRAGAKRRYPKRAARLPAHGAKTLQQVQAAEALGHHLVPRGSRFFCRSCGPARAPKTAGKFWFAFLPSVGRRDARVW